MADPEFPRRASNPRVWAENVLFDNFENCMKIKEIGRREGRPPCPPLDPPMMAHLLVSPTQFLDPLLYFNLEVFTVHFCASYVFAQ